MRLVLVALVDRKAQVAFSLEAASEKFRERAFER